MPLSFDSKGVKQVNRGEESEAIHSPEATKAYYTRDLVLLSCARLM